MTTNGHRHAAVPTDSLLMALKPALAEHLHTTIVGIDRRPSRYSTSCQIEDVGVVLGDGRRLNLVFKDLSPQMQLKEARRTRPAFVYQPLREIQIYSRILATEPLGTPYFFGSGVDIARDRYWLFIEKVAGVELYQVGEVQIWMEVARWVRALHDQLACKVARARTLHAPPIVYDAKWYRRWMKRAASFADDDSRAAINHLAKAYDRVLDHLCSLPVTLIHGDLYASNVLVSPQPSGLRVCPVDWERAAIAPGLMDLATLTMGWQDRIVEELALAYAEAGERPPAQPLDGLMASLAFCRLHLCIQWLGWASDWRPPREHSHDWLAEALKLADVLGL